MGVVSTDTWTCDRCGRKTELRHIEPPDQPPRWRMFASTEPDGTGSPSSVGRTVWLVCGRCAHQGAVWLSTAPQPREGRPVLIDPACLRKGDRVGTHHDLSTQPPEVPSTFHFETVKETTVTGNGTTISLIDGTTPWVAAGSLIWAVLG